MKKNRIIAVVLAAALVCSLAGISALAAGNQKTDTASPAAAQTDSTDTTPASATGETVYVIANADGSAKKVIVSQKYDPDDPNAAQEARSSLTDAVNVKDDNCWQGTTDKPLPVTMRISYTLDGKSVSADALAGKSGHVTMRFDYENTQYETKTIAGKSQRIYVPFAVLTGAILDSENFRNVSVTNGKLVDDGDHTVVVGIAFPGLQENLALDTDKLDIPSYVEVSADVTDFAIETTLSVVTNSVFNDVDDDKLDKDALDELSDDLDKLTDAMEQLMDGSDELFDGLDTLLDKSHELADGVDQLASGLKKLDANSAQLNEGAKTVFNSLLNTANTQLQANESLSEAGITIPELTISNYADVLNGVIAKLDPDSVIAQAEAAARQQVTAAVQAQEDTVRAAVTEQVRQNISDNVTAAVKASVLEGVLKSQGMTQKQYEVADDTVKIAIGSAVDAKMNTETVQQNISATVSAQMASPEVKALIDQNTERQISLLIEQNMNSEKVRAQIDAATSQATAGAKQLLGLRQQLDSYNTFYMGLQTYTASVAEAAAGAVKLNKNMPDLIDGVKKLRDGSLELADGIKELNEEGIEKLVDAFDGDLTELSDRLQATIDVSRDYRSFINTTSSNGDGVKFIFRTDAIDAD
mgnify:FL=1